MMYSWEEIALMYREELETLHGEMEDCSTDLRSMGNKITVSSLMNHQLGQSAKNVLYIQSFESIADKKPKKVNIANTNIDITYDVMPVEEVIRGSCYDIYDTKKEPYVFADKCGLYFTQKWMSEKYGGILDVLDNDLSRNEDNVFRIKKFGSNNTKRVKVLVSGMKFKGRTRKYGSEDELLPVELQHTYIVDPKEERADIYIFAIYLCSDQKITIKSRVGGKYIDDLLVDPLRERFIGKRACILQESGYNKSIDHPRSISELIKRSR